MKPALPDSGYSREPKRRLHGDLAPPVEIALSDACLVVKGVWGALRRLRWLDDWLGETALSLFEVVPFEVGIIGFDVACEEGLLPPKSQRRGPVAYLTSTGYHKAQY